MTLTHRQRRCISTGQLSVWGRDHCNYDSLAIGSLSTTMRNLATKKIRSCSHFLDRNSARLQNSKTNRSLCTRVSRRCVNFWLRVIEILQKKDTIRYIFLRISGSLRTDLLMSRKYNILFLSRICLTYIHKYQIQCLKQLQDIYYLYSSLVSLWCIFLNDCLHVNTTSIYQAYIRLI